MSRGLATVPHAPIERRNHTTGEIEHLPPGQFVNVAGALGIFARVHPDGSAVVVQLPKVDWIFVVPTDAEAVKYARQLTHIANR